MPTLNIKNFPPELYETLRDRARRERRSMAQEVVTLLATALEESEQVDIRDLKGLGKEVWGGIDAAEHVEAERSSWK